MSTRLCKSSSRKAINNSNGSAMRSHHKRVSSCGGVTGTCGFIVCKRSCIWPVRLLKHVGDKVAEAMRLMSVKIRSPSCPPSSGRSNPYVSPVDAYRSEAIEACIEFINASSSSPRSNSLSANSR